MKDGSRQRLRSGSRPGPPAPLEMTFRAADLPLVRRRSASWALRAGMAADVADDFVIAVNEIATNAVRHGSPEATLRLWVDGRAGLAEIRDQGHWPPRPAACPSARPSTAAWAWKWPGWCAMTCGSMPPGPAVTFGCE